MASVCEKDPRLMKASDLADVFKERGRDTNKYDYGFVGILGGSENYSGAAKLANLAACACAGGAGVVRLIVAENIKSYVAPYLLESTLFSLPSEESGLLYDEEALSNATRRLDALAVGMGMGANEVTRKTVEYLLANFKGKLVIDADGLNALSGVKDPFANATPKRVVLTPHVGEFARLTGLTAEKITADPIDCAENYAKTNGVILLLKGSTTIVTDGTETLLTRSGDAGMATAGSGDVLSGVLSAFGGFTDLGVKEVAAAAYVCGRAAEIARENVCALAHTASDTVSCLKRALTELCCR